MERRAVELVIQFCPILTPPLTAMPMLVIFQLFGDTVVAALILMYWLLPIAVALAFDSRRKFDYYIFMSFYFGLLCALVGYLANQEGIGSVVVSAFKSADFYLEIVAEVSLANVVVSDLLCANL